MTYLERLQQSEQEKSAQEVQSQAKKANLKLQADILATEESLLDVNAKLEKAMCAYPLNLSRIIELQVESEGLKDGLDRAIALKVSLFPEGDDVTTKAKAKK